LLDSTARSVAVRCFSLPPKVPNGVRLACTASERIRMVGMRVVHAA
jgi:hypothetical protein